MTAFGSFSTEAEAIAVANSKGIRAAERRTSSQLLTVTMGPDNGTGYAEQCAVDATTIDAAAIGREAAERPGRARTRSTSSPATTRSCSTTTRSSTCSTCSATSGSRPSRSRRTGRSSSPASGSRRRWSRSPTTAATPPGCRWASTPRACPKQRLVAAREGRVLRGRLRRADRGPRRPPARPATACPAPNPYGPFPTNMVMAGGRRRRRGAGRRPRPRPARHPLPLHEPGARQARDHHRHDPRRDVPRRGRRGRRPGRATSGSRCPTSTRSRTSRRSRASGGASAGSSAGAWCRRCGSPRSRSPARRRRASGQVAARRWGSATPYEHDLTVIVEADGTTLVDVGSRAVRGRRRPTWSASSTDWRPTAGRYACWVAPAARTTVTNRRIARATPRWAPPPTSLRSPTSSASR